MFCQEVQNNIDAIKLATLNYVDRIIDICMKNDWKINPAEALKAAFMCSNDKDVHTRAKELRNKLVDLRLYKGFTIEYIDFFINKKDVS